jgi:hypothetical protein
MNRLDIEEIIQRETTRWSDCDGTPARTLLRLGLLRELTKTLHSEKSRCLASGLKSEVQKLKEWEAKIDLLRETLNVDGSLIDLLKLDGNQSHKKNRLLPEALFQKIDRNKLFRYDRKWEAAIAAEAISLKWPFWSLETWVKIPQIEEWNKTLEEHLWPRGLVLFIESATLQEKENASLQQDALLWRGHWVIILDSHFKSPQDLSLNIKNWPGAPETWPNPPQWKCIYT